jgi:hypothetical protein
METYLMATIKRRVADLQRQIKYDTVDNSQLRKERFRGPSTTFAIMNKDTLSGADTRKLFDELGSGYEKGKRDCSQRGGNQDTSN